MAISPFRIAFPTRVTCWATVVLCVTISLSGCGANKPRTEPSSPLPSALSPSDDPTTAVAVRILAVYNGYLVAYRAAVAAPDPNETTELRRYIGDPLLSQVGDTLQLLVNNNLVVQGGPKTNPRITELRVGATPPVATIEDCYDISEQHVLDKATGARKDPPNLALRYQVTYQAKFFDQTIGWLIVQGDAHRDRPC